MNGMVSCEYNMDSGCIELTFVDGTEIAIGLYHRRKPYSQQYV